MIYHTFKWSRGKVSMSHTHIGTEKSLEAAAAREREMREESVLSRERWGSSPLHRVLTHLRGRGPG